MRIENKKVNILTNKGAGVPFTEPFCGFWYFTYKYELKLKGNPKSNCDLANYKKFL